jgi:hypothetical protein
MGEMKCRVGGKRFWSIALVGMMVLGVWLAGSQAALASLHTYHERPGQVTIRSRLSLRDRTDRAWQAIVFKRQQGDVLQGIYLRLVGFPEVVEVDRSQPVTVLAPTGQQRHLMGAIDPQTRALPPNVGQYDLQPLLTDLDHALPLELRVALKQAEVAELAIAPFMVDEWLQVKVASPSSPAPVTSSLGKEP